MKIKTEISAEKVLTEQRLTAQWVLTEQRLTAQWDQVTRDKAHLEERFKELKAELAQVESTVQKREESVIYWRNLHNGVKSILSAQGNAVSRAAAWDNEEVEHAQGVNWSSHTVLTRAQGSELQKAVAILLRTTKGMTSEAELYPPFRQFMSTLSLFNNHARFVDTSQTKYLARQAPDLSICIPRATKPHAALVHAVIEVKKRGEDVTTAKHLGQLKEYMLNLVRAQSDKGRLNYWGFITNMETIILVEITLHGDRACPTRRVTQYPPMQWPEMVRYIYSTCQKPGWIPPTLYFSEKLGPLEDLIVCNRKWQLGVFQLPPSGKKNIKCMVVKVSVGAHPQPSHSHELDVLRYMRKLGDQPASIIKLVWEPSGEHPQSRVEFGISPRGKSFSLSSFMNGNDADTAFQEIIDGIHWLHSTARVIHRDIRGDNIILDNGHPVIIDFDCAYRLPLNGGGRDLANIATYSGGLICVPNRVIKKAKEEIRSGGGGQVQTMTYEPEVEDDLFAFVILVIAMLFPIQFDRFPVHRLSWPRMGRFQLEEMDRFHEECENSLVWGKWWNYAKWKDYERLKGIGTVCLFPSGRAGIKSKSR